MDTCNKILTKGEMKTIQNSKLVLDFSKLQNAITDSEKKNSDIYNSMTELKTTWNYILEQKEICKTEYFGIKVRVDEIYECGLVVKRDNLYIQGLFNPNEWKNELIKAFVLDKDLTYKEIVNNRDMIVTTDSITTAFREISNTCSAKQLTEEKCRQILESAQGRMAIFCISEAARFAYIRLCVTSAFLANSSKTEEYAAMVGKVRNKQESLVHYGFYKINLYSDILTTYGKSEENGVVSIEKLREIMAKTCNKTKNQDKINDMKRVGLLNDDDLKYYSDCTEE